MPDTPTPSPDALIEEVERLDAKSTKGPWSDDPGDGSIGSVVDSDGNAVAQAQQRRPVRRPEDHDGRRANAIFIARARTLLPLLASHLRAAMAERNAQADLAARLAAEKHAALAERDEAIGIGCNEASEDLRRHVERVADTCEYMGAGGDARALRKLVAEHRAAMAERDVRATSAPLAEHEDMGRWKRLPVWAQQELEKWRVDEAFQRGRADTALSDVEAMRANWASAVNDIATFLESCDDSRDDPLAYAAGEVRQRWGSALDARGQSQPRWRPEVAAFADVMERELRENDHKGVWKDCDVIWLLGRLHEETIELKRAVGCPSPAHAILSEAADVANFAMMIADVCGALDARGKNNTKETR